MDERKSAIFAFQFDPKVLQMLLKMLFMGEQTFLGKFMGELFYMGSNEQIMQGGRKSFTNAFYGNLNRVNLKFFPGHVGKHT